jgi:uncharacterized delta-60 repeat protein
VCLAGALAAAVLVPTGVAGAAPGDLDASFGGDGIVTTRIDGGQDSAEALVVQGDGKLVAAGSAFRVVAVTRYNEDGSLDPSFGGDGIVTTYIGFDDEGGVGSALALQEDGKLVVAGRHLIAPGDRFAFVRYNRDGSLDRSFGSDGVVSIPIFPRHAGAEAVVQQADGKLVAAGWARSAPEADDDVFALVRVNPDGSPDTSFGAGGIVLTSIGRQAVANALVVQDDGRLVAAGWSRAGSRPSDFALVRYDRDGRLDTSFGGDGKVTTPIRGGADAAEALVLQEDGRLVAAGWARRTRDEASNADFAIARYRDDGSLDSGFGGDGKVTTPLGTGNDFAYGLALQENGMLVAAGASRRLFAVVRYRPSGQLDQSFGEGGKVTTAIGPARDVARAAAIQPNGRIVAAGSTEQGPQRDFALARYRG